MKAAVVGLALLLSGCACAGQAALTAVGVAGAVVLRDPVLAVAPAGDLATCLTCAALLEATR